MLYEPDRTGKEAPAIGKPCLEWLHRISVYFDVPALFMAKVNAVDLGVISTRCIATGRCDIVDRKHL